MKTILFTGGSSFTGFWFVRELAQRKNHLIATFQSQLNQYSGIRRSRIDQLLNICQPSFETPFGSETFFQLLDTIPQCDIFCHHAADVTDYRSAHFNVSRAVDNNTKNLKKVLDKLKEKGCQRVILTGSIFEQNEGMGSSNLQPFSPYGLSKGLTSEIFKYYCSSAQIPLGKFVIPNPFGPFEEMRFTSSLIQTWKDSKIAHVNSPSYVRDNIHVSLLAKAFAHFTLKENSASYEKFNPSGYPESQGSFTTRFAEQMRLRLNLPCEYILHEQKEFPEPKVRINIDVLTPHEMSWNENDAWRDLANYYLMYYLEPIITK